MEKVNLRKNTDNNGVDSYFKGHTPEEWRNSFKLEPFLQGRVFIPYSQLPEDSRHHFLQWLCSHLEAETGKQYVASDFHGEDPYPVAGIFIQVNPSLLDKDNQYTYNNDIVYDANGTQYHVSYYESNGLRIVLDNPNQEDDCRIVMDLSAFTHSIQDKNIHSDAIIHSDETVSLEPTHTLAPVQGNFAFILRSALVRMFTGMLCCTIGMLFQNFFNDPEQTLAEQDVSSAAFPTSEIMDVAGDIGMMVFSICGVILILNAIYKLALIVKS